MGIKRMVMMEPTDDNMIKIVAKYSVRGAEMLLNRIVDCETKMLICRISRAFGVLVGR